MQLTQDIVTVKAAAERLGISQSLCYALLKAGKIRHVRHGIGRGTIRIPLDALAEYERKAVVTPPCPDLTFIKPR